MTTDKEHLHLLSIFHYVVAGVATLFSFFPLLYVAMGVVFLYAPSHPSHGEPPPPFLGWLFIGFGCFFFLLGVALAVAVVFSGRFIHRHRRYWFSFVVACVECLFIPFGLVLGVFTILVLSRQSVKKLYGIEIADTPVAPNPQGPGDPQ